MLKNRKEIVLILIVSIIGFVFRLWGINHNLPLLPDPDEQMNVNRALSFGSGDLNPHNFKHPATHQYMLSFLFGVYFIISYLTGNISSVHNFELIFISDPTYFYLIARVFIAILGSLTLYLVYLIGRENYGADIGIISSVFLAVSIGHATYYIPKGEIPTTFFTCLSFIYILRIYKKGELKDSIYAGIFAGLAVGTKYYSGLLLIPIIICHILYKLKTKTAFNAKNIFYSLFFMALIFFTTNPFVALDFKTFIEHFKYQMEWPSAYSETLLGFGAGHLFYLKNILTFSLGWIIGGLSITGILFAIYKHKEPDLIMLSYIIPFFIILGATNLPYPRYMMPIFPFLAVLGSKLFYEFLTLLSVRLNKKHNGLLIFLITIFIILLPIKNLISYNKEANKKDIRIIAKEWIESNIPENSKILVSGLNVAMIKAAPLEDDIQGLEEKLQETKDGVWGISKKGLSRYYKLKIEAHKKGFMKNKCYNLTSTRGGSNVKAIDYYILKQFDYFVLSDEIEVPSWNSKRMSMFPNVVKFYNDLKDKTVLIKSFSGKGKTIKIFKLIR